MSRAALRGRLKVVAVVFARLLNTPATLDNRGGWFVSEHPFTTMKNTTTPPPASSAFCFTVAAFRPLLALGATIIASTGPALAAPGDSDLSFGTAGIAVAKVGTFPGVGSEEVRDLLIQPDGKLLAVGRTLTPNGAFSQTALARFNPDGTLDQTFGEGGKAVRSMGGYGDVAVAACLQSDGKIIVAGSVSEANGRGHYAVARLNSDGSFDSTFSDDGVTTITIRAGAAGEQATAIGIQPDGKIVVAGTSRDYGGLFPYSAIARLNPNGTLDTSFTAYNREPRSMVVLPDGRFVLAGGYPSGSPPQNWIARYEANGTLQSEAFTPVGGTTGGSADSVKIDAAGNLWTSGVRDTSDGRQTVVVRYPASTYLGGGTVILGPVTDFVAKVAIQPNGKVVVSSGRSLVRYNPDGTPDTSFSGQPAEPDLSSVRYAVVCQGNGSILVGGSSDHGYFGIARFLGDGNPPTDISASSSQVAENLPGGTLVGTLTATDPDAGDLFQFALAPGTGDSDNGQFSVTGNQLFTAGVINFEEGATRSIRVRVTDSGSSILEKILSVTILDDLSEDLDGDGLNQAQEKFHHSSDFSLDSDVDGLGDYAEVYTYHSRPGSADSDGDGIRDGDELARGTGIIDPDSDDDGLQDGAEIARGANPLVPDTDDDGFLDGYEVETGKSPVNAADRPALQAAARTAIEFTFPAAVGKTYRIEESTDLATWTMVESGIIGTGGQVQRFYSTRGQPKRYFRVEEQPIP